MIGGITLRKVSVSSSTRTRTSMRACGLRISVTGKAPTGEPKETSYAESTQATGMKTRSMAEEPSSTRMEIGTMATGSMDSPRAKVE